jgi:hypothetical protein
LVESSDPKAGDCSAAIEEQQRLRETAAVVSLFVAKIVGAQQFAGGIMQSSRSAVD